MKETSLSRPAQGNGISVIICCYNSGWVIRRTLEALKAQKFNEQFPYEIVLVDNRCTDETVAIAEDTMKGCAIDFRIVREDNPGLANARRRGINEIKYEYVIFCDDDNILCSDYVSTMAQILHCMPKVGAAGGKGIAEFECEPDEIVKKNIHDYAVGSQLQHKDFLFGAGLASRTKLITEVYNVQKCYLMGRKGKELLSGDDTELVLSFVLRGYKIYPTDKVYYTHVLKSNRLTKEYLVELQKGLCLPVPVFEVMRAAIYDKGFMFFIKDFLRCYKNVIKYSLIWWKPWSFYNRKEAYEKLKRIHYWGLIHLYKIYRQWVSIKKSH